MAVMRFYIRDRQCFPFSAERTRGKITERKIKSFPLPIPDFILKKLRQLYCDEKSERVPHKRASKWPYAIFVVEDGLTEGLYSALGSGSSNHLRF